MEAQLSTDFVKISMTLHKGALIRVSASRDAARALVFLLPLDFKQSHPSSVKRFSFGPPLIRRDLKARTTDRSGGEECFATCAGLNWLGLGESSIA
jgi:hypothetical protein